MHLETSLILNARLTLTMKCPDGLTDHKSVKLCQAIILHLLVLMVSQFGVSTEEQIPPVTQCLERTTSS